MTPPPVIQSSDKFREWLSSGYAVVTGKIILAFSGLALCYFGLNGMTLKANNEQYSSSINFVAEDLRIAARNQTGYGLALIGLSLIISPKKVKDQ